MPYPSTPCGRATPETAVFYPVGHPTPYAYIVLKRCYLCPKWVGLFGRGSGVLVSTTEGKMQPEMVS
jgi:hypothetical protein